MTAWFPDAATGCRGWAVSCKTIIGVIFFEFTGLGRFSYFCPKVLRMKFLEFLALHDYFNGLIVFVLLIAFIVSLRYYGRHRALRIVPYYIAFWFLMEGVEFYRYISPRGDPFANALDTTTAVIFTMFEFCVFSLLVLHYIAGTGRRLAVKLNTAFFFLAEIFLYFRMFPRNPVPLMGMLEAAALVPPCIIYYYELFTNMNTKALNGRPSFWVVTAILYQGVFNTSLLLSMKYMGRFSDGAYAFGILFYCTLFVLFMKAYKCSPEERVAGNNVIG
jgi:hypothetical protein